MSALGNGFRILEAISGDGDGLTFSEVVDATNVPKATVHRLLRELVDLSALTYDESTRRYRGGLLLAGLGASVMRNYDVRRIVRPHLEALHELTGSVATLGIRDGEQGIYVDKIEPVGLVIRLHSEIGKSFPLHCTAMGKVLLRRRSQRKSCGARRRAQMMHRRCGAWLSGYSSPRRCASIYATNWSSTLRGSAIRRRPSSASLACRRRFNTAKSLPAR